MYRLVMSNEARVELWGMCFCFYVLYKFDAVFDGCVILEFYVGSYHMVHVFS